MILMKISKIDATRCQILRLKCTKFDIPWGSTQTPLGELTAISQAPYVYLWGLLLRGGRGREGKGEVRGGEGSGGLTPQLGSLDPLMMRLHPFHLNFGVFPLD